MSAMPAGILDVPTPKFRMTVGKSSAVYRGMMTLDEDTENLPAITSDSDTHSSVSAGSKALFVKSVFFSEGGGGRRQKVNGSGGRCYVLGGRIVVNRHAIPPATMVTHNGILRPIFSRITTLIIIDGISTTPAQRRSKRRLWHGHGVNFAVFVDDHYFARSNLTNTHSPCVTAGPRLVLQLYAIRWRHSEKANYTNINATRSSHTRA